MDSNPECSVMAGVSTAQNTTNLVPFVQFGVQEMLLAETNRSKEKKWATGITKVIEDRDRKCHLFSIGDGDNLAHMIAEIDKAAKKHDSVCWNFGGGQKMQQLAMFNVFQQRLASDKRDWACYSDPALRVIQIIETDPDNDMILDNENIVTDSYLKMEEIITVFAGSTGGKKSKLLWERYGSNKKHDPDQLISEDDLSWFYDYEKRQKMFEHYENAPAGTYPEGFENIGDYFERVVQHQVLKSITENPMKHVVNEVWANVNVFDNTGNNKEQTAEYDILLTTRFGTVIPLDAKCGFFNKKEEDARSYNLEKISGQYTKLYPVFPCFPEDADALHSIDGGKKLLDSLFTRKDSGKEMLVLSEPGLTKIFIGKDKKDKVIISKERDESDKKSRAVDTLENMITSLKLSVQET